VLGPLRDWGVSGPMGPCPDPALLPPGEASLLCYFKAAKRRPVKTTSLQRATAASSPSRAHTTMNSYTYEFIINCQHCEFIPTKVTDVCCTT
jgi:hypothetical protein